MENVPIQLSNGEIIHGKHPVVIIGPNGSGKTTFGSNLAKTNNATWVGATRNLQFEDSIVMQTPENATSNVVSITREQMNHPWLQSNELNQLLAKLKAEDSQEKVVFANNHKKGIALELLDTKLDKLSSIWGTVFPKREIDFSSYSPKVKANHVGESLFGISRMSGGERVALYLLARVLDAPSGLIFIDEPEIHFHGVLARKFWNELEVLRSDCRFVYITHDLPFAVSRDNVQFVIVNSASSQTILDQDHNLPDEVIESILGAATFSVSAKRIVFCESTKTKKWDDAFYSAWFNSEDTAVIPVGSCAEVTKCVEVFNQNPAVIGMRAIGIIDRDFHSEDFLSALPSSIHALKVHEIESLFCAKDIFMIIGKHLGKTVDELNSYYEKVVDEFSNQFNQNEIEKNKIILERVKQRTEWQSKNLLNLVKDPSKSINDIKTDYLNALKIENWSFVPGDFFDEEKNKVESILSVNDVEGFLKIFPGKVFLGKITQKLGITSDTFLNIIIIILNNPKSDLRNDLILALQSYLPTQDIVVV